MVQDRKKLALIVEDEHETAMLISEFLVRRGFETKCVQSGVESLVVADKILPDLILLDIAIPDMNGFDVLVEIKSRTGTKHIPVIICSASDRKNEVPRWIEWGASGFVPKPFNFKQVVDEINDALNPRRKKKAVESVETA